jgi:hypothetical protein
MLGTIKDNTLLLAMAFIAESFCSEENAELKRHIEPRKSTFLIQFCLGNIVNCVITILNDLTDLLESIYGTIVQLQCASWHKPGSNYRKNDGIEKVPIIVRKRAVDENVSALHPRLKRVDLTALSSSSQLKLSDLNPGLRI